jgi:putative transcriptional regulator
LLAKREVDDVDALFAPPPFYTPEAVKRIRVEVTGLSQTVFAELLNVKTTTVKKWESPASGRHPSGAAARLLQLIEVLSI